MVKNLGFTLYFRFICKFGIAHTRWCFINGFKFYLEITYAAFNYGLLKSNYEL